MDASPLASPSLSVVSEQLSHTAKIGYPVSKGGNAQCFPPPRNSHATAICQDTHKMYLYGGYKGRHTYFSDLWELDIPSGLWTQLLPQSGISPSGRGWHTLTLRKRELWVIGGRDDSFSSVSGLVNNKTFFQTLIFSYFAIVNESGCI